MENLVVGEEETEAALEEGLEETETVVDSAGSC